MSRDRLRELRPQTNAPVSTGYTQTYDAPQAAPVQTTYEQPAYEAYPMEPVSQSGPIDDRAFFQEIASIQDNLRLFETNIVKISDLHGRRIAGTGDDEALGAELTQATNSTNSLSNSIRNHIVRLNEENKKRSPPGDAGFEARKKQVANLQKTFQKTLSDYHVSERHNRDKYRNRVERQFKIVKPDATDAEVSAVLENDNNSNQIFTNALMESRQVGARAAYAEVQSRNQDLRKIEDTMRQVTQMLSDMATLILEQDDAVRDIENNAQMADQDMKKGHSQAKKATLLARAARKKRWICFWLLVIVIIVVVIAVVVPVTKNN